jgi:hypothetical protein
MIRPTLVKIKNTFILLNVQLSISGFHFAAANSIKLRRMKSAAMINGFTKLPFLLFSLIVQRINAR